MTPLMWERIILALITAVPPTLVALAALLASLRNGQKADEIHKVVNGNLQAAKAEAYRAGLRDGESGVTK